MDKVRNSPVRGELVEPPYWHSERSEESGTLFVSIRIADSHKFRYSVVKELLMEVVNKIQRPKTKTKSL